MHSEVTLAQLISTTREKFGWSQSGLAKKANVPVEIVENIEAGQDLFLPSTVRQKLAKALRLELHQLKSIEKQPTVRKEIPADYIEELKLRMLEGQLEGNACPVCGSELICRIAIMQDLEDNVVKHPKARCSKCPFQIR